MHSPSSISDYNESSAKCEILYDGNTPMFNTVITFL